jgi:hypothetical protein
MQHELVVERINDSEVLRNIPIYLDLSKVMTRLSFHSIVTSPGEEVQIMVKHAVSIARPEAIYKSSPVKIKVGNDLKIDGINFNNSLLRVNLKQVDHVFPYVVTCRQKMDLLMISSNHDGLSYMVNIIQEMILAEALNYLRSYITNRYNLDYLWSLMPGELQAWPAEDRTLLFSMLGNVEKLLGVRISSNNSLVPKYSACGIFYDAEMEFEGCQVCPQETCMGRRAPYCEELAQKFSDRARRPCGVRNRNMVLHQ